MVRRAIAWGPTQLTGAAGWAQVAAVVAVPPGGGGRASGGVRVSFTSPWKEKKGSVLKFADRDTGADGFVDVALVKSQAVAVKDVPQVRRPVPTLPAAGAGGTCKLLDESQGLTGGAD